MGRAKFKIPGLILLFLISLAVWFRLSPKDGAETAGVTYTVLSEPRIPVLWAETCGRKMDVMRGYLTDTDADIAADTLILKVLDESGSEIASDTQTVSIPSGESESVTFAPVLPAKLDAAVYTVNVMAGDTDRTPDDNQAELDLTKTDIAVETEVEYEGDRTLVTIYAENESNVPAAVCLHVKPMRTDAETLELVSDVIEPHKAAFWQLDSADVLGDCYRSFVLITAESETADADMKNNSTMVMLSKSGFDPGKLGDINLDGKVGLLDSTMALKCYTRQVAQLDDLGLSPTQMQYGDVDKNGNVDLFDAMILLRYYVDFQVSGKTELNFEEYIANEENGGAEA